MLKISQLSCFITNNSPSYRENESNQKLDITQFGGYFANLVLFYTFIMEENTKYLEYSSVQSVPLAGVRRADQCVRHRCESRRLA